MSIATNASTLSSQGASLASPCRVANEGRGQSLHLVDDCYGSMVAD